MTEYTLGDRGTVQIITDDYYDAEILHIFEELLIDRERVWNGDVRLVPEPDNPYQPCAIAIYIDDLKVGRMSPEDSQAYWNPICRVVASGHDAIASLQLTAVLRGVTGETFIESTGLLSLSAPGSIFPLNEVPSESALLPQGASMKVLDEKDHSEYLHGILPDSGEGRVILSLENNQIELADGRMVDSVDVLHDDKVVGRLSTQVSEQLAPVIRHVHKHHKVTSAWGTIRGNAFELSLTIQTIRPSEITQDWYDELPNFLPELLPEAARYEVPNAYVPSEGENQRENAPKKKRSIIPSRSSTPTDTPVSHGVNTWNTGTDLEHSDISLGLQRVAILTGVLGGLILATGVILIFFKPILGILGIILGASVASLAFFYGRDHSYNEEEVSEDLLEH